MTRVTVSIEDDLMEAFDAFLEGRGYTNRSEGFRDLIREKLQNTKLDEDDNGAGGAQLLMTKNGASVPSTKTTI